MKVIEGGKGKRRPKEPDVKDLEASAMRAQPFARKAIIGFLTSEAQAQPEGDGIITAIGMQAGFLMSVIEAGFIGLSGHGAQYDKDYFVGLAGSVFDDVANRQGDEES